MTTENKDIGFIKLFRSIEDWDWWSDHSTSRLFLILLLNANWKDKKWRGRKIKRGQLWTSLDTLVQKTGLSKMQVRNSLDKLERTHEITRKITHSGQLITVVNYDFYQSDGEDITHQPTHDITQRQHSDNTAITLTKEVKEYKELNNSVVVAPKTKKEFWSRLSPDEVDTIYESYPESGGFLIQTVAAEVVEKKRKVESPVPYILSYAKRVGWDDKAEHFDYWEGVE